MKTASDKPFLPCLTRRAALAALALLAGCGSDEPPPPPPPLDAVVRVSNASWDQGSVVFWTWNDTVLFAVWVNQKLRPQGQVAIEKNRAHFTGALVNSDGTPVVEVDGTSFDGKRGRVTVNGQRCEIANGWLMLYAKIADTRRLRQITVPPLSVPPTGNPFQELRKDPRIQEFFAGR